MLQHISLVKTNTDLEAEVRMWRGKYEELKQQALQAAQHGAALGREKEGMLAQFEEMSLEQQQVFVWLKIGSCSLL